MALNGVVSVRMMAAAGVLLGMVGLAWLDRAMVRTRILRTVNEQSLAPGVNIGAVSQVRLVNRHGETRLALENGQWQLKAPVVAPADGEKVETLIHNVTGARRNNEIAAKNLATYGLSDPAIRLELVHGPEQKVFSLALGNDSTYTGQVFAQYPGGRTLFTVGAHVKNSAMAGPSDFRRMRLLDIDPAGLATYQQIVVGGMAAELELRQDRGRWLILAPVEGAAEGGEVEEWLRSVGMLRAEAFLSEQGDDHSSATEALAALTSPTATLKLVRSGGPPQELHLAQIDGGEDRVWVARRPGEPELLLLRPETVATLRPDIGSFRSRQIFTLKPADVGQLSVAVGQARTDLLRNPNGRWILADQPGCDVDQEAVAVRLESILKIRAKQFIDLAPQDVSNFGIPRIRYTLTSADGQKVEHLETGDLERGGGLTTVYARRRGDPAVFTIDLPTELVIFRDTVANKHFARFNYNRLSRMVLELGSEAHEIRLKDRSWLLRRSGAPAEASAEKPKVDRFITMMDNLQSSRDFGCSGDRVISPPAQSHFAIKAFDADGGALLELTLGRADGDRVFVTVNNRVVVASNAELERLIAQALSIVQ